MLLLDRFQQRLVSARLLQAVSAGQLKAATCHVSAASAAISYTVFYAK
jgi:hypothetical protein